MGTFILREYQREGTKLIFTALNAHRRVCYVLPTGGGKTAVAVRCIQQWVRAGKRVIVLVHRTELVDQMEQALIRDGIDEECVGRIRAEDKTNPGAPVQVASVLTLARRAKPVADYIVVDECHHAVAETWKGIMEWYPDAKVLGLTATPIRIDGRGLAEVFDVLVQGPVFSALEKMTPPALVAPRVFAPLGDGPDLSKVGTSKGDYDLVALAKVMGEKKLVGDVPEHYLRHAEGRRGVVYCVDQKHAHKMVAAFLERGIKAEYLGSDTPLSERRAMIGPKGRLARGVTKVICNCLVLGEGWDLPPVKCCMSARPTKSLALYNQTNGRSVRPWVETHGKLKGIPITPLILDHAGNYQRFGLPHADRVFDLNAPKRRKGEGGGLVRQCPACGYVQSVSAPACGNCSHVFFVPRDRSATEEGDLVEVTKMREEEMRKEWERLLKAGEENGHGRRFAEVAWEVRFAPAPIPEVA